MKMFAYIKSLLSPTGEVSCMRAMALMLVTTLCYCMIVSVHSSRPLADLAGIAGSVLGAVFIGKAAQKFAETK